jgi:hypothetical protein
MITGSYDNSDNDDKVQKEFVDKMEEIYERSLLLKADTEFNFKQVTNLIKRLDEANSVGLGVMGEKVKKELKIIIGRIKITINEVKKMDKEYELLSIRVNKFYGKELLKPFSNISYLEGVVNDILKEMNEGEEWKNG